MNQKISTPVAVAIAAVVLIIVIVAGTVYYRNASGASTVDKMEAAMRKAKPGQSPFSPQQMQQMRSRNAPSGRAGTGGP